MGRVDERQMRNSDGSDRWRNGSAKSRLLVHADDVAAVFNYIFILCLVTILKLPCGPGTHMHENTLILQHETPISLNASRTDRYMVCFDNAAHT